MTYMPVSTLYAFTGSPWNCNCYFLLVQLWFRFRHVLRISLWAPFETIVVMSLELLAAQVVPHVSTAPCPCACPLLLQFISVTHCVAVLKSYVIRKWGYLSETQFGNAIWKFPWDNNCAREPVSLVVCNGIISISTNDTAVSFEHPCKWDCPIPTIIKWHAAGYSTKCTKKQPYSVVQSAVFLLTAMLITKV